MTPGPDPDSRSWLLLHADGEPRRRAVARLHGLLLGAARFEVARRRPSAPDLVAAELDSIALRAAADALVAVLTRLEEYRGENRFATWACKFALLEAAVAMRRRAWRERELPSSDAAWSSTGPAGPSADEDGVLRGLLPTVQEAAGDVLGDHQREVFTALVLNRVPIDVLAERLGTTRGALYESLQSARRELRRELRRAEEPSHAGERRG